MPRFELYSPELIGLGERLRRALRSTQLSNDQIQRALGMGWGHLERVMHAADTLNFRATWVLWRDHHVNPAWLYDGQGEPTLSPLGFHWLESLPASLEPFEEVFAAHLAPLFAAGAAEACALFQAMDRAKARVARGEAPALEIAALTAAVAALAA